MTTKKRQNWNVSDYIRGEGRVNNFLEEYWSEVGDIALAVIKGAGSSRREKHAAIESAVKGHKWMDESLMHHTILVNTKNGDEINDVGFQCEDVSDVIKQAAYWAFYADVTDEIRDMKAEGLI